MRGDCRGCTAADELIRARRRIEEMEREIKKMRRAIEKAKIACLRLMWQAQKTLSKKSGVPRGTWAFWLGVMVAASCVYRILAEV